MKKIILKLLFCASSLNLFAQYQPWRIPPSEDYLAVEPFSEELARVQKSVKKERRWFFMDKEGKLSTDHYAEAYSVSNGLAAVFNGKDWQFRKKNGDLLEGNYEEAFDFYAGGAVVQQEGKWGVIDLEGKTILDFKYDHLRPFANQRAGAKQGDKVLIINLLGNTIGSLNAGTYVHVFSEGMAAITNPKGDFAYIDTTGKEVILFQKGRKCASSFGNGFAAVSDTLPHLTFINREGKRVFSFKNGTNYKKNKSDPYDIYQHQFKDGYAAVRQGKWGFIDTSGKTVIPYEYDAVTPFSEGFAAVEKDGKWLYINEYNTVIQSGDFSAAKPCTEDAAWVKTKDGWGFLSIAEKLEVIWDLSATTSENKAKIKIDATYGLDSMELFCNGKRIQKHDFTAHSVFKHEEGIPLDTGKLLLECTAWANGKKQKTECILYHTKDPIRPTELTYSAVLIGNDGYKGWSPLGQQPIRDADSLASILYQWYQFKNIQILHDASLKQMKHTLQALTARTNPNERILVFYAGHGAEAVSAKSSAFLVPVDAKGNDTKTYFSAPSFVKYVNQLVAKHVLCIVDACYAGSFAIDDLNFESGAGNRPGDNRGSGTQEISNRPKPSNNTLITAETLVSRQVMTSGQKIPVPNASVFINYLFKNLLENKDNLLRANTLFNRFNEQVSKEENQLVPQFGRLGNSGHDGGDFVFRKKI
jgi:Caspase domain/WG containing repeat